MLQSASSKSQRNLFYRRQFKISKDHQFTRQQRTQNRPKWTSSNVNRTAVGQARGRRVANLLPTNKHRFYLRAERGRLYIPASNILTLDPRFSLRLAECDGVMGTISVTSYPGKQRLNRVSRAETYRFCRNSQTSIFVTNT